MDYSALTVAQPKDLAKQRGIDVPSKARKADIVELLGSAAGPSSVVEEKPKVAPSAMPTQKAELRPLKVHRLKKYPRASLVLKQNTPQKNYRRGSEYALPGYNFGQMKLLMTEIYFLTKFHRDVENPLVVYAGAAPCTHLPVLLMMFPKASFHLYDPRFDPSKRAGDRATYFAETSKYPQVKIFAEYFTDDTAREYAGRDNVFFWSDIRRYGHGHEEIREDPEIMEREVMVDMEMQKRWVEIMSPFAWMLKFRLPYIYDERSPKTMVYLNGEVMLQPRAPVKSTETRLIGTTLSEVEWDNKKYESQLYYHNTEVRSKGWDLYASLEIIRRYIQEMKTGEDPVQFYLTVEKAMESLGVGMKGKRLILE